MRDPNGSGHTRPARSGYGHGVPEFSRTYEQFEPGLFYKVGDQVAGGPLQHNKGMTKKEAREKVLEIFKNLEFRTRRERIDCYPHQFSGGMKQRVVIAIAMIRNPERSSSATSPPRRWT